MRRKTYEDVRLVIPTTGRADRQLTLDALPARWVQKTRLVCHKSEAKDYESLGMPLYLTSLVGIGNVRQDILSSCLEKYLIMLDDDLVFYHRVNDGSLVKTSSEGVGEALDQLVEWLKEEKDVAQTGMSLSILNPHKRTVDYAYNEKCTTAVALRCEVLRKHDIRYDLLSLQEDNHVTLSLLEHGYKVKVSYRFAFQNIKPKTKSGATLYRTYDTELEACQKLVSLHPKYVSLRIREQEKNTGYSAYDCRVRVNIRWKRAYDENKIHGQKRNR